MPRRSAPPPARYDREPTVVSPCGTWRWIYTRRWGDGPSLLFVLANPSTADERKPDPTAAKCERIARALGYPAATIVNVYAFRAADPLRLRGALSNPAHAKGPERDGYAVAAAWEAAEVVCGWGGCGGFASWPHEAEMVRLLRRARRREELLCASVNSDGRPAHPLYLPEGDRLDVRPWDPSRLLDRGAAPTARRY